MTSPVTQASPHPSPPVTSVTHPSPEFSQLSMDKRGCGDTSDTSASKLSPPTQQPPPSLSSCTNYFLKKKCHYCHQRTFSQVSPVTDGVTDGDTVTEGCVTDLSPPGPDGIDPQPCYRYDRGSNGKECEDMRKKGEGRGVPV